MSSAPKRYFDEHRYDLAVDDFPQWSARQRMLAVVPHHDGVHNGNYAP
jgi:hypothetical protein